MTPQHRWTSPEVVGMVIGDRIILSPAKNRRILVRCACGREDEVYTHAISPQCRACSKTKDHTHLIGRRFGELTITGVDRGEDKLRLTYLCDCGVPGIAGKANIESGRTATCGHSFQTDRSGTATRHDVPLIIVHRLYGVWKTMHRRCSNPADRRWHRYGARGIQVSDVWAEFDPFFTWAIEHGYRYGLTLDRVDNDGPYSPENCQWASDSQQSRNKVTNVWVEAFGERKIIADWITDERCQVSRSTLGKRVAGGWPHEAAVSLPPRSPKPPSQRA